MPPQPTTRRRTLTALLIAAFVVACGDELNAPQAQSCDERLELSVEEPATVEYRVRAGNAIVASVTFTTPVGDSTITSFPDQDPDDFSFDRNVQFAEPADAQLRAVGEVATAGQIAITYTIIPDDGAHAVVNGPIAACGA